MANFKDEMAQRRSIYALSNQSPLSDDELQKLLEFTVQTTPTAFNMQSTRAVLLLGESHQKLWDIVLAALKKETPPERFGKTQQKIASFAAGHGTILYFDDTAVTSAFAEENPLYANNFPIWAQQQNGMLQYAMWTCLSANGLGASLQHYNPLIDEEVAKTFKLPESWSLIGQMPFGTPAAPADEKDFVPIETRLRIFK